MEHKSAKHRAYRTQHKKDDKTDMDYYVEDAKELGCTNPEVLRTFNPHGAVTHEHRTCIDMLDRVQKGNKWSKEVQPRQYLETMGKINDAKKWLYNKGVKHA